MGHMQHTEILQTLKSLGNRKTVAGMAKFGINPKNAYGISIPSLRRLARQIGKDHPLAERLWSSGIHEARILSSMIDDPAMVTEAQLERWVRDFDSWDLCDQCCGNLFDKTEFAYHKAIMWSERSEEFVKRAGFVLMAALAVHDKEAHDGQFAQFFSIIKREAIAERNFVRKAVNWALRQIGKRNRVLNSVAIEAAREIQQIDSKAARWIAANALRELASDQVQRRLRR